MITLKRGLGPVEAFTLVVGGIIGVSIFLIPSAVARIAGSPLLALSVWALAGVLSAGAALCYAELGASIPQTGGTYIHLHRAYRSEAVAFAFAWMMCFAYGPGALAVVAIMTGNYLAPVVQSTLGLASPPAAAVALAALLGTTALNLRGVRAGGQAQNAFTLVKVALLVAIIALPMVLGTARLGLALAPAPPRSVTSLISIFSEGLALTLFSFSGAFFVTQVAGEIRNPQHTIPKAIYLGFGLVFLLYLGANYTFLSVIPLADLQASPHIASDTMERTLGPTGKTLTEVAIGLSAIAVLNAQLLSYPRIAFALAARGYLFRGLQSVGRRTGAPWVATLIVSGLAMVYVLSGTFEYLLTVMAFISHMFVMLTVAAVIVLRIREPDLPRPYRVWGYPVTPVAFLLVSSAYLYSLITTHPRDVLVGVAIVAASLPAYALNRHRHRGAPQVDASEG